MKNTLVIDTDTRWQDFQDFSSLAFWVEGYTLTGGNTWIKDYRGANLRVLIYGNGVHHCGTTSVMEQGFLARFSEKAHYRARVVRCLLRTGNG